MKLSANTKKIFENFATVNQSLLVLEGTKQKTMNTTRTFLADVIVEEDFPKEFGIYDLNKFLSVLSLFKDPDLEYGDRTVTFKEGTNRASFTYCDSKLIKSPPKGKDLSLKDVKVAFTLTSEVFSKLQKAARILGNPDLVIDGDGETLRLAAKNNKDTSADTFVEAIGDTTETFTYSFDIEALKFIAADYDVEIDVNRLARFTSKANDLTYWVTAQTA